MSQELAGTGAPGKRTPRISVVLCCHNSAKRLPETLRHLSDQEVSGELDWEILVIDNASSDETPSLVKQFALDHPRLSVRLVNEPKLGQTYARHRGIAEARYEVILFVDDDNWLKSNYVALVAETLRTHDEIAALGGLSTAQCEGLEPSWLSRYQGWYAVTGPAAPDDQELREEPFLWTAGAAFRRRVLDHVKAMDLPLLLSGRRGDSLDGGEDVELSHQIRLAGGRMFRHSGLHFRHYLPAGRLTRDYLRRLVYASGVVSVKLDAYRLGETSGKWPAWILRSWWAQLANVSYQLMRYRLMLLRPGQPPMQRSDRVLRLEAYRGRFDTLWSSRRNYREMVARKGVPEKINLSMGSDVKT